MQHLRPLWQALVTLRNSIKEHYCNDKKLWSVLLIHINRTPQLCCGLNETLKASNVDRTNLNLL